MAARDTQVFPQGGRTGPAGLVSDPWSEIPELSEFPEFDAGAARAVTGPLAQVAVQGHDPQEVTVQLDSVQEHELGEVRLSPDKSPTGGGQEPSDGPVFVDESGRRGRRVRRLGMAVGIACAVYAVVIVVTLLSGSSDAPWLPVPGQHHDKPSGKVDTSPRPADSGRPSGGHGRGSSGGRTPKAGEPGTTPSPGARTTAPGTGKTSAAPGTSTAPRPTESGTAPGPGSGAAAPTTVPEPSVPASSDPPAQSSPAESPTAPAQSPAPGGGEPDPGPGTGPGTGGGAVAGGPANPSPLAAESGAGAQSPPQTALSPEHTL
ncbi:hypothetical protein [Streptomyces sp. NPDC086787]|uniref:hypothetical protein n=1 Tax=Streptomyces sp. NPDC086787 TaxID=3365759 RepID=UPI0038175703